MEQFIKHIKASEHDLTIPMRALRIHDLPEGIGNCPICGKIVDCIDENIKCPICGQYLDWEGVEVD